ncbi:MAG: acyl-CoA reductase, partial [Comamonadaceae bacterium]
MKPIQQLQAGYLPGIDPGEVDWHVLRFEKRGEHHNTSLEVSVPVLSATQMNQLAARVRQASALHLKTMTVPQIIDVIDRAIARLLDRSDPYR